MAETAEEKQARRERTALLGDTFIIVGSAAQKRMDQDKEQLEARRKTYLGQKFVKVKALKNFGGMLQSKEKVDGKWVSVAHPDEQTFHMEVGDMINLPIDQAKNLVKVLQVEIVK